MSTLARECKYKEIETPTNVNVISLSTPYMLNLHPVTISSTISDAIGLEGTKLEDTDSVDGSMTDGMEHIFGNRFVYFFHDIFSNPIVACFWT